jgi:DNA repair protein RecN (Recombination protein N)
MLEELIVQNYALIDHLELRFAPGLNILTGETGAGKSILVGALGLILGLKADTESIRAGAEEIDVSGVVRLEGNPEAESWVELQGILPEDHRIIIRRVVKRNGKGSIYVQSRPFTQASLRELTGMLFDLQGQHEHQSLLSPDNHRRLLDHYGGLTAQVQSFGLAYAQLIKLREELASLLADEKERLHRKELLRHAVEEIQQAALQPDEEQALKQEQLRLANHEKLAHLLEETHGATSASTGGALGSLRQARQSLGEALKIDAGLSSLGQQLDNVYYELEDFTESVGRQKAGVAFDPSRLESVEERLALIKRLQRKYGATVPEVLEYLAESQKQLLLIEGSQEAGEKLEAQIGELEQRIRVEAAEISRLRRVAATDLQGKMAAGLEQLGMPKVRFQVEVKDRLSEAGKMVYAQSGKDLVEFLISPNLGEPFKRLIQIASGGELSRIMLAIKAVLAEADHIHTLIFDEVDAGIGGEVALAVGDHLRKLAQRKQVLCITHLATIAARADNHIKVEKLTRGQRTITTARSVAGEQRREEIARMLAGDRTGDTSLKHAGEILQKLGDS